MIDVKQLLEAFDNDWDLIKELVALCQIKVPEYISLIGKAVADKDFHKLEHHAHTLKGSIAHFNNAKMYDLSYQLEVHGREKNPADIEKIFADLLSANKAFEADMKELAIKAEKRVA